MEPSKLELPTAIHDDDTTEEPQLRRMELPQISLVLTIPEVAEILRLSPHTVKRLVQRGKIKAAKTGDYAGRWRISANAVEKFLAGTDD